MTHQCSLESPSRAHGEAITLCREDGDGTFWAGNSEYESQVNYCPMCGAKAPVQMNEYSFEKLNQQMLVVDAALSKVNKGD